MPKDHFYIIDLDDNVRLRIEFSQDAGEILGFVVQLEAEVHGMWKAVVRYDTAHGRPHIDFLDQHGRQIRKLWVRGSFNDVFTVAANDLRTNWAQHLARFMEDT